MKQTQIEKTMKKLQAFVLLAILFLIIGMTLQTAALNKEINVVNPTLDEYFGQHTKAERDSAEVGSELALMQAEVAKFPPTLLTYKLVGVGSILTGIFILLFVILQALKLMPLRLAEEIKKNK